MTCFKQVASTAKDMTKAFVLTQRRVGLIEHELLKVDTEKEMQRNLMS